MPGQRLHDLRIDSSGSKFGDVPMPQAMEVGHAAFGIFIGQKLGIRIPAPPFLFIAAGFFNPGIAGGFQIGLYQLRRVITPPALPLSTRPEQFPGRLVGQPFGNGASHVEPERLHVATAALAVRGIHGYARLLAVELERFRLQACEFSHPQARVCGHGVHHRTIGAGQVANSRTFARGFNQSGEFIGRQGPAFQTRFHLGIHRRQMGQRVYIGSCILHQPTEKRFAIAKVVIAGLNAHAVGFAFPGQPIDQGGSRNVAEVHEFAAFESTFHALAGNASILRGPALGGQPTLEIVQMNRQRLFAMFGERVEAIVPAHGLAENVRQLHLRGLLVASFKRNNPAPAGHGIPAIPLLRPLLDGLGAGSLFRHAAAFGIDIADNQRFEERRHEMRSFLETAGAQLVRFRVHTH
ncbi:MAG TPA: hypothetical protein VKS79_15060 [Gemmataceae bacterium]|nr:hypothetical protein [Gemmataceae bacterium]